MPHTAKNPGSLGRANRGRQKSVDINYTAQSPTDQLLSRLDGVRQTGPGKWLAHCPAHNDRSPSLGIRETEDGRVLVHCWAGCMIDNVLAAVGLTTADLFPQRHGRDFDPRSPRKPSPRFIAADLLELAALESRIVAIAACDITQGRALSPSDLLRVSQSAETLAALVNEVRR